MVEKQEATEKEVTEEVEEYVNPEVDHFEEDEFEDWEAPVSNWFKFENIGDRVTGLVVEFNTAGSERPKNDEKDPTEHWSKLDLLQSNGDIVSVRMNGWLDTTLKRQQRKIIPRVTLLSCIYDDTRPPRQRLHDPTKCISIRFLNPGSPKYDGAMSRYDLTVLDVLAEANSGSTEQAGTTAPDPF